MFDARIEMEQDVTARSSAQVDRKSATGEDAAAYTVQYCTFRRLRITSVCGTYQVLDKTAFYGFKRLRTPCDAVAQRGLRCTGRFVGLREHWLTTITK